MKRLISLLIVSALSILSASSKTLFQSADSGAVVAVRDSVLSDYIRKGFLIAENFDGSVSVYRDLRFYGRFCIFFDRSRRVFLLFKL